LTGAFVIPAEPESMMPKSVKRFSDHIMLSVIGIDHVHDFGSIRSKIIVIERREPESIVPVIIGQNEIQRLWIPGPRACARAPE
jgi:hypothetical protein